MSATSNRRGASLGGSKSKRNKSRDRASLPTAEEEIARIEQEARDELMQEAIIDDPATPVNDEKLTAKEKKKRTKKRKQSKAAQEALADAMEEEEVASSAKKAKQSEEEDSYDSDVKEPPKKKAASNRKKKAVTSPIRTAVVTSSPSRTKSPQQKPRPAKTPPRKRAPAASLKTDDDDDVGLDLPTPPPITQLQRTQSTPLELELQHQVVVNAQSDLQQKPPPYTEAPPAHLMQFAPRAAPEGYDDQDSISDWDDLDEAERHYFLQDDDDDDDDKLLEPSAWTLQDVHILLKGLSWMYIISLTLQSLYRRTIVAPFFVSPQQFCYRNNVPTATHYQGICQQLLDTTAFQDCPRHALCWGGSLIDCRFGGGGGGGQSSSSSSSSNATHSSYYYELDPATKTCQLTAASQASFGEIVSVLEEWTLAYACRGGSSTLSSTAGGVQYPDPAWAETEPFFVVEDVMKSIGAETAPFRTSHVEDAVTFLQAAMADDDKAALLSTTTMPNLHFSRRQKPQVAAKGTPIVGLSSKHALSLRSWWLPLSWQCSWNKMPFVGLQKAETMKVEAPKDLKTPLPKDTVKLSKGTTPTEEKPIASKKKPAEKKTPPTKKPSPVVPTAETKAPVSKPTKPPKNKDAATKSPSEPSSSGGWSNLLKTVKNKVIKPVTKNSGKGSDASGTNTKSNVSITALFAFLISQQFELWASVFSVIGVLYLYYQQQGTEFKNEWMPEVARLRELAIDRIQNATNGGWEVSHLRDAVVGAAAASPTKARGNLAAAASAVRDRQEEQQEHLQKVIWPRVLEQLREDDRIAQSTLVSATSGRAQTVVAWKASSGGDDEGSSETPGKKVTIEEPIQDDGDDRPEESSSRKRGRGRPRKSES